jgi:hypothetical protein
VDVLVKRHGGDTYLFAAGMRNRSATASFTLVGGPRSASVEVLGEDRVLPLRGGQFADSFTAYAVHLYRVRRG